MSNHNGTLVSIDASLYHSQDIKIQNKLVDIGLLAESLIYYDKVNIIISTLNEFYTVLNWMIESSDLNAIIDLIENDSIKFYNYCFTTHPVKSQDGSYKIINMETDIQASSNSFPILFLDNDRFEGLNLNGGQKQDLKNALLNNGVIEEKAKDYVESMKNAMQDFENNNRMAIFMQSILDGAYAILKLGAPPVVKPSIEKINGRLNIKWHDDIFNVLKIYQNFNNFNEASPFSAAAVASRILWSASKLNCDIYVNEPRSSLICDKLYEVELKALKSKNIIDKLHVEVDFPSIRDLVNNGSLNFDFILQVREKSKQFRNWLQDDNLNDMNAIKSYHKEIAYQLNLQKYGRVILRFVGPVSSLAIGATAGPYAAVGSGYLFLLADHLLKGWKPLIFGNWLDHRIKKLLG